MADDCEYLGSLDCSANGVCVNGTCVCNSGFSGNDHWASTDQDCHVPVMWATIMFLAENALGVVCLLFTLSYASRATSEYRAAHKTQMFFLYHSLVFCLLAFAYGAMLWSAGPDGATGSVDTNKSMFILRCSAAQCVLVGTFVCASLWCGLLPIKLIGKDNTLKAFIQSYTSNLSILYVFSSTLFAVNSIVFGLDILPDLRLGFRIMGALIALYCLVPFFVVTACCVRLHLIINATIGDKQGVGEILSAVWRIVMNKGDQDPKYAQINIRLQISTVIVITLAPGAVLMGVLAPNVDWFYTKSWLFDGTLFVIAHLWHLFMCYVMAPPKSGATVKPTSDQPAPKNAEESEGTEEDAMDESFEQWSKRSQVDTDITSSVRSAVEHRESSERRGS
uniref:Tenascin EGF-like domain-containing protein n=2 Tax=Florenciella parvula TaxID=236787 RepID=A0A7S2B5M6_9STRA|mmetsp:Transcript_13379/g.28247  ORF Transcript_13379/g.28247 Transcript_13379/m.28247 type:complete len:392 (+) Transcript_13379:83-1258(+)|eukprot:CAMPEP_0182523636 /NCGR_PEP_ID=MMETSP1323-20130603/1196_1 /TAXON_ID=236787 /ORGANISM="Florenciella parvula, Strain RCC1693" /LENGTH=391 /DNA_ID=CAMNT_0024732039 /DNA_START=51 /DNA_END=1226 /DNA_ORIENTATION=+